uniref:Reverse transcriptase Ty1/copia-type domain-containing protein n=1 Tax=Tanacetum cinerariifolium TaxID=118510 RepID=A0A6L2LBL1_TANCI|nr:hypothetical protein [Tanacetum cinerariifolium]
MGGSYYPILCSIISIRKDCKTPQRYPDVLTTSWRISIRSIDLHDTQYCMENPKQVFVEYASSRTDEVGGKWYTFKPEHNNLDDTYNTSWRSHPNLSSINAITIHPKLGSDSRDDITKNNEEEERDIPESHYNSSTSPDLLILFLTEKVLKFNSLFESLGLVPPSPNAKLICTKEEDEDVMFIEIIPKDDDSRKEEPEVEGATTEEPTVEYFNIFPTRDELTYHRYLMSGPIPSIFFRNPIIMEGCPHNLKIPCNIRNAHIEKAYIDLNSLFNIMTRMMYNWIIRRKLNPREGANGDISNFTGRIKGMHVFIGNFTYVLDFMIVEDISSFLDLSEGLILYQAYGNFYAMTDRKAHLLEDKKIPSVEAFDEVSFYTIFGVVLPPISCVYAQNRVPNKRNKITPYKLWTKRKPNLNYLRVCGCRVVVRLPDPKLKTLGERGIECIFVDMLSILRLLEDEVSDQHSYYFSVKDDPKTFDEAMKSRDVSFWKKAINDEIDSIIGNNTWVLVDLPLVARISTIRLLIAIASIHNLIIHQMDVKTAFLNGDLDVEVYMNQPHGFIMPDNENKVCKLIKSLYGLKQAPKRWDQKLDEVVLSNGYLLNQPDNCVYSKFDKTGKADVVLGIRIKHESSGIEISQSHYIEKVLKKLNYFDYTIVSTPMDTSKKFMPNNGILVILVFSIQRVLKYLKKTMDYSLTYTGYPSVLEGYTDASSISNTKDNSSTTAGKEAEWLKNFLIEIPLWSKPIAAIYIRCESAATLAKAYSQIYNEKSRHLGVRHSMIHELITNVDDIYRVCKNDEFEFKKLLKDIDFAFELEKLSQDSLEKPKEVKMEEHMYDEFDDVMYDTYDGASISGYEADLETWMGDDGNMIYTILLKNLKRRVTSIEAKEVVDLLGELDEALGEHVVDLVDDGNVVPIEVVAEEMLEDHAPVIKRKRKMAKKGKEDNAQ